MENQDNQNQKKEINEIQDTIIPIPQTPEKATEEEFYSTLKLLAPGTAFRTALDGALKIGKGALIAIENEALIPLMDGGFRVNCRFTPQRLMELTKMDGAIILSKDLKRITHANVLLTPESKIKSLETGTRHKAAERTAKQISGLVVAISERRHEINIFYKNIRHTLKNTEEILRKVNEQVQLIEKQRELFDKNVEKLNKLELKNYPSLHQAVIVLQKGKMIQKIGEGMKKYLVELGSEGTLQKIRLKEITSGIDKEVNLIIKDYTRLDMKKSKTLIDTLTYDEILDAENMLRVLAYEKAIQLNPIKGWRLLSRTQLHEQDIATIIKHTGSLGKALYAKDVDYNTLLGDEKAIHLMEEIEKIKMNQ
ncbi:MAG: DNA integrity scanning diadenylate cyclase DisA [Nanoarchaeota archaeon]